MEDPNITTIILNYHILNINNVLKRIHPRKNWVYMKNENIDLKIIQ